MQATSVVGTIQLAGTVSESDWYSFTGNAGDIVTIDDAGFVTGSTISANGGQFFS